MDGTQILVALIGATALVSSGVGVAIVQNRRISLQSVDTHDALVRHNTQARSGVEEVSRLVIEGTHQTAAHFERIEAKLDRVDAKADTAAAVASGVADMLREHMAEESAKLDSLIEKETQ